MHDNYDPDLQAAGRCEPKQKTRGDILLEAHKVINGDRQDQYGNPEDSFELISDLWEAYLKPKIKRALAKHGMTLPAEFDLNLEPRDSALMMAIFKIAREEHQRKRDNLVDGTGYMGIASDL